MSRFSDVVGETYKVIKGYVPKRRAKALAKEFVQYTEDNKIQTREDIPGVVSNVNDRYNHPTHLNILSKKTSEVGKLVGSDVNPAYSYSRVYHKGSELARHVDRPSCEVSLTIHLDGDKPWAFCIENLEGETVKLVLEPGDAVLYDAPNAYHWRDGEYKGETYCNIFHHYVYVDGEFVDYAFDTAAATMKLSRKRSDNLLTSFIYEYNDLLDEETMRLAHEIMDGDEDQWVRARTAGGSTDYRKCLVHDLTKEGELDQELDKRLFEITGKVLTRLNETHNSLSLNMDDGYKLLRYPSGEFAGKYDQHTDHSRDHNRFFTIIFILNDDYEGGELSFFNKEYVIKPKKGTIIAFPSAYMFPHAVHPCTAGERRSIITWAS